MFWKKKKVDASGTLTLGKAVSEKIDKITIQMEEHKKEQAKKEQK